MKRAYTLVELIIVITVMMILTGLISLNLVSFSNSNDIDSTKTILLTSLFEAQNDSASVLQDKAWGVHFESTKIVIYADAGSGYQSGNASNITKMLGESVKISWALEGGGSEILFQKRTGETSSPGKITLSKSGGEKLIEINSLGMINYQ